MDDLQLQCNSLYEDDGDYVFRLRNADGTHTKHLISVDTLALLDTRLPVVVHALTRRNHSRDLWSAAGALAATLRYWETPVAIRIDQMASSGNTPASAYVLDSIVSAYPNGDDTDTTFFLGYNTAEIVNLGGVEFVKDLIADRGPYSHAWCEQHFPGSVTRISAALALELRPDEVAMFGFYPAQAPANAALPSDLLLSLP